MVPVFNGFSDDFSQLTREWILADADIGEQLPAFEFYDDVPGDIAIFEKDRLSPLPIRSIISKAHSVCTGRMAVSEPVKKCIADAGAEYGIMDHKISIVFTGVCQVAFIGDAM